MKDLFKLSKVCPLALGLSGLLAAVYLVFVSAVSIWIGVGLPSQDGDWVPVAAGGLLLTLASWAVWYVIRRAFLSRRKAGFRTRASNGRDRYRLSAPKGK